MRVYRRKRQRMLDRFEEIAEAKAAGRKPIDYRKERRHHSIPKPQGKSKQSKQSKKK